MKSDNQRKQDQPITYGDVFPVGGDLAGETVAPIDASMMQMAETTALGRTKKGGAAASMQSAAARNETAGFVQHEDITKIAGEDGVAVSATAVPGAYVVTETVAGQVVDQYGKEKMTVGGGDIGGKMTIGEAVEMSSRRAGEKAVDERDAAAIHVAEEMARGKEEGKVLGGVGDIAMGAAMLNKGAEEKYKVKLGEVVAGARMKIEGGEKAVTVEDADKVVMAERSGGGGPTIHPGGVGETI